MKIAILLCAGQKRNYRRGPEGGFLSEGDSLTCKPAFSVRILELKSPSFPADFTGLLSMAFLVVLINQWFSVLQTESSTEDKRDGNHSGSICCHASAQLSATKTIPPETVAANTEPTVGGFAAQMPEVPSRV